MFAFTKIDLSVIMMVIFWYLISLYKKFHRVTEILCKQF